MQIPGHGTGESRVRIKSLFLDGDGNLYSLVVSKEDIPRLFKHRLTFHK